jgi:hypothetical protein
MTIVSQMTCEVIASHTTNKIQVIGISHHIAQATLYKKQVAIFRTRTLRIRTISLTTVHSCRAPQILVRKDTPALVLLLVPITSSIIGCPKGSPATNALCSGGIGRRTVALPTPMRTSVTSSKWQRLDGMQTLGAAAALAVTLAPALPSRKALALVESSSRIVRM